MKVLALAAVLAVFGAGCAAGGAATARRPSATTFPATRPAAKHDVLSHIVLTSPTLASGESERGTLVIVNRTAHPIHWACGYLQVQLVNATHKLEVHPTPCSLEGKTFPVGTTRLPFTVRAGQVVCEGSCAAFPPGEYHTQLFSGPNDVHPGPGRPQRRIVMGRIVITEFIALDGAMQAPGGPEDGFERSGWTFEIDGGEEFGEYKLAETRNTAAMLLGRKTYDGFAASWPSVEGEFGDRFNALPKYVVSSTLRDPSWNNTTVLAGDVTADITALRDRIDGDIVVHGSAQLAQHLFAHDLVDELRLMVFPVVLGLGKRLFADEAPQRRMHLTDTKVIGDGIALLVYSAR